ncbi:MAG: hypothetical protein ACLSXC_08040 [Beduini sp.]
MNIKMIKYIIGKLMVVEALLMILPYICGLIYKETTAKYFFNCIYTFIYNWNVIII